MSVCWVGVMMVHGKVRRSLKMEEGCRMMVFAWDKVWD